MQQSSFIRKEETNVIKGVALIFMFIHHFFTFPSWLPKNISYPIIGKVGEFLCEPFALCVPIFAFLTGYFYYFTKDKSYRYSLRKSTDLWVHYLIIFALLLIPTVLLGCYEFSVGKFALECVGLYLPTMKFCWYVSFYFMAIFMLPLFAKGCEKNEAVTILGTVLIPVVAVKVLQPFANHVALGVIYDLCTYLSRFCCVISGFVFAKYRIFEQMEGETFGKTKFSSAGFSIALMGIAFLGVGSGRELGAIAAPLFIFALLKLTRLFKNVKLLWPLTVIGKYSLSLWFLHSIFFNQCEGYTKNILYWPKNPVLVLLWGLGLCLTVAVVVEIPIKLLVKLKNRGMSMLDGNKIRR